MPTGSKIPVSDFSRYLAGVLRAEVARQKPTMSQTALAEGTGISQSQISKYLTGKVAPNTDELQAICRVLGRSYLDVNAEAERELVKAMKGITDEQRTGLLDAIERNRPERRDDRGTQAG